MSVRDADEVIRFIIGGGEHEEFVEVPFASVVGAGEDQAFGGEHDNALVFIYLQLFTGDYLTAHGTDAKADTGADGDADTGGAADVLRGCATGFMKDSGGRPESVFTLFLHEGVGDRVLAIRCGGEDGDDLFKCFEIFAPDSKCCVVCSGGSLSCALCLEVCEEAHG